MSWFGKPRKYKTISVDFYLYRNPSNYNNYLFPNINSNKQKAKIFIDKDSPIYIISKTEYSKISLRHQKNFHEEEVELVKGYWFIYKNNFKIYDTLPEILKEYAFLTLSDLDNNTPHKNSSGIFTDSYFSIYKIPTNSITNKYTKTNLPIYPILKLRKIGLVYQGSIYEEPIKDKNGAYIGIYPYEGNINSTLYNFKPFLPEIYFGYAYIDKDNKYVICNSEQLLTLERHTMEVADREDKDNLFYDEDIISIDFRDEIINMVGNKRENNLQKLLD